MHRKYVIALRKVLAVASMCALGSQALADMPSNVRTFKKKDYVFGSVVISQTFDSRKDPMDPVFRLQMRDRGRVLLVVNDVAFDDIVASPDGELFVGLSNGGWPGSAAMVFDRRGRVWFVAHHGAMALEYSETSTFLKEWYDAKNPGLRFAERNLLGDDFLQITLRNCNGETVGLWDVVKNATDRANAERQRLRQD
ncbi:hypothetical protein [Pseudoduganella sp. OTU4001]|uniref:hypothetical protein n=1 Tax=Pseudoduganella sp. OTU4001 TaxID=3043854 RepID=UPI00313C3D52